jgi:hypothetical protein
MLKRQKVDKKKTEENEGRTYLTLQMTSQKNMELPCTYNIDKSQQDNN